MRAVPAPVDVEADVGQDHVVRAGHGPGPPRGPRVSQPAQPPAVAGKQRLGLGPGHDRCHIPACSSGGDLTPVHRRKHRVGVVEPSQVGAHAVVGERNIDDSHPPAVCALAHAELDGIGVPRQVGVLRDRLSEEAATAGEEQHFVEAVNVDWRRRAAPQDDHPVPRPPYDLAAPRNADGSEQRQVGVVSQQACRPFKGLEEWRWTS